MYMQIIEFYREERGNNNGDTLEEILNWPDGALEVDHDYIQWLFPSNEQSQLNGDAPTLTKEESNIFFAESDLSNKVQKSFHRFLRFLGMHLVNDEVVSLTDDIPEALSYFNHNFLRITRCLKSLRLTNNEHLAKALYKGMERYKAEFSPNTWDHWTKAVSDNLWSTFT